jgi:hypothetical protein
MGNTKGNKVVNNPNLTNNMVNGVNTANHQQGIPITVTNNPTPTTTPNVQVVGGTVPNPTHSTLKGLVNPVPTGVVMVPTTKQTLVKRGTSTVPNPVGMVYVTCINHLWVQVTPGVYTRNNNPVHRNTLHQLCMGVGVTYYTVRTQVHNYLKVSGMGTIPPTHHPLPKGVTP